MVRAFVQDVIKPAIQVACKYQNMMIEARKEGFLDSYNSSRALVIGQIVKISELPELKSIGIKSIPIDVYDFSKCTTEAIEDYANLLVNEYNTKLETIDELAEQFTDDEYDLVMSLIDRMTTIVDMLLSTPHYWEYNLTIH